MHQLASRTQCSVIASFSRWIRSRHGPAAYVVFVHRNGGEEVTHNKHANHAAARLLAATLQYKQGTALWYEQGTTHVCQLHK